MLNFSIKQMIFVVILITIGAYFLTLPFKNMTTVTSQEMITIIDEQLNKGNKVLIDDIEIKENPNIYIGDKFNLKIENDEQGNEVYKFYIVNSSKGSNVMPFIVPMLR